MTTANTQIDQFTEELRGFFAANRRDMPWRESENDGTFDPYKIMVSEVMLQQTQVLRVVPKFEAFLVHFPSLAVLAKATLGDVLAQWQGLGYNRRAKFLWQTAQTVVRDFDGDFPQITEELVRLPGIGVNTAGAIMAYAWDKPVVFIETNIRSVFIHSFFTDSDQVADKELAPLVGAALKRWLDTGGSSREFYWALMDYGSHLKATAGNHARRSTVYTKQSKFAGSKRQVRGTVLRALSQGPLTLKQLGLVTGDERTPQVCEALAAEGLIHQRGDLIHLGV